MHSNMAGSKSLRCITKKGYTRSFTDPPRKFD